MSTTDGLGDCVIFAPSRLLPSPEPSGEASKRSTKPSSRQVAAYPASGRGAERALRAPKAINARGLSLVELLVFIAVVGVAVTGVLAVYNQTARASADPVVRKQALAVAESLLEEVLAQPFTYCDPDDPAAETATAPGDCAVPEAVGPEAGETRAAALTPFDNVNDYAGLALATLTDLTGAAVPGLAGYAATIDVQAAGAFNGLPAGETLRVTVTVTGPGNHRIVLDGYRTRHAPNF